MNSTRKNFSAEFKKEAVKMSQTSDQPLNAIAKSLGVALSTLSRWRQESDLGLARKRRTGPVRPPENDPQAETVRMRREIERLRMENEILKKAAAFFAKEQW